MINLRLKHLVKHLLLAWLSFIDNHPRFRHFCLTLLHQFGIYKYLRSIYLRLMPYRSNDTLESTLTRRARSIYYQLKASLEKTDASPATHSPHPKKRLAYVSPLPPVHSGISDYSKDLLPLLAQHYDIDVIVNQDSVSNDWINHNCTIRSSEWLKQNPSLYDRVIYHFGNSPYHTHMFELLEATSGVVVLHDFFLGHLIARQYSQNFGNYLYQCHGYNAVDELHHSNDKEQIIWKYPLNFNVINNALNIIVHDTTNQQVTKQFYGADIADAWPVIPLLRQVPMALNREDSRSILGLDANAFIVCSFGLTGPIKLSHRLLEAWLNSSLAKNKHCMLIFAGENDDGKYGQELLASIQKSGLNEQIRITGWVDDALFHHYLAAADLAVQLRTQSRGETSAAVLDCMNYGLATIANANGTLANLHPDAVYLLADDFDDINLTKAIETLWQDDVYRKRLAHKAKEIVSILHDPDNCAQQYVTAIESAYRTTKANQSLLISSLTKLDGISIIDSDLMALAQTIDVSNPPHSRQKQLLIDISAIANNDLKTGIQRVIRAQLEILLRYPPEGYRVEPVFLSNQGGAWHYRYARGWTIVFLDSINELTIEDEPAEFYSDDILFCADLNTGLIVEADKVQLFQKLMARQVRVFFQVFDLLPITHPEWFPTEANKSHLSWAKVVANSSGAFCISNAVANEFKAWCSRSNVIDRPLDFVKFFHLGADINTTAPSIGRPDNADEILKILQASPSFLMVGTLEPRKGHAQTLAAFEQLWQQAFAINLVIVGKQGWLVEKLINKLKQHKETNHHLFWLESISDEFLQNVYSSCCCLIAASEDEGFGLPLIEAAQHKLPIIARNIPVFREVAGQHAYYFEGLAPNSLALAIQNWLNLSENDDIPKSTDMPWLTWRESTEQLINLMGLKLPPLN